MRMLAGIVGIATLACLLTGAGVGAFLIGVGAGCYAWLRWEAHAR